MVLVEGHERYMEEMETNRSEGPTRTDVLERYVTELVGVLHEHGIDPPTPPPGLADAHRPDPLSGRENEVLALAARGLQNSEIAAELFVGVDTVKTHLQRVYRKIGVRNRAEAAVWYVSHAASAAA